MTWSQENCLIDNRRKERLRMVSGYLRVMGMGILRMHSVLL